MVLTVTCRAPPCFPRGEFYSLGAMYHPQIAEELLLSLQGPAATDALCSSLADNTDADEFRIFVVRTWILLLVTRSWAMFLWDHSSLFFNWLGSQERSQSSRSWQCCSIWKRGDPCYYRPAGLTSVPGKISLASLWGHQTPWVWWDESDQKSSGWTLGKYSFLRR